LVLDAKGGVNIYLSMCWTLWIWNNGL
jgi:hypothetical protein